MRRSLIALAAAGIVATGAAGANGFASRVDHAPAGFVAVQDHYGYGYRWDDRRFSVEERQDRIAERIRHGRYTGALTRLEARQLYDDLATIRSKERSYLADGFLDPRERDELHRDLDRLAWNLRAELRDNERRY